MENLPEELKDLIKKTIPSDARILSRIASQGIHVIVSKSFFGYSVDRFFMIGDTWLVSYDVRDGQEEDAWKMLETIL